MLELSGRATKALQVRRIVLEAALKAHPGLSHNHFLVRALT